MSLLVLTVSNFYHLCLPYFPGPRHCLSPGGGTPPQLERGRAPGGRSPAPGGPFAGPGAASRGRKSGHHPRGGHRGPQARRLGPPEAPSGGEGPPRRRQPRASRWWI